jgi:hypothetical protein
MENIQTIQDTKYQHLQQTSLLIRIDGQYKFLAGVMAPL